MPVYNLFLLKMEIARIFYDPKYVHIFYSYELYMPNIIGYSAKANKRPNRKLFHPTIFLRLNFFKKVFVS